MARWQPVKAINANDKSEQFKSCSIELLLLARSIGMESVSTAAFHETCGERSLALDAFGISNVVDILKYKEVLFIFSSLQMVHLSIRNCRALVQSSTAVDTRKPLRQRKVGANWRCIFPKLVLFLPLLVCVQISG